MQNQDRLWAPFLILAASVLWGTTGTTQAFAPAGATPLSLGVVRLGVGGVAMFLIARVFGSFSSQTSWPKRVTFVSAISLAAFQPLFLQVFR